VGKGKNFKRGAPGDKGGHNPINSRMPEEYVCVVGSCSNTYNGYIYWEEDPKVNDWVACPNPKTLSGVQSYLKGPPGKPAITHDVYWANFLEPAIKLYANQMVKPKPGDVVTIMVFMKGYLRRQSLDWDASPYNLRLHRNSPWVAGNPEYDPSAKGGGSAHATRPASPSTPQITSLTPNAKTAGDAGFNLIVNGSGFLPGAKVTWEGSTLSTAFISATLLSAVVPSSTISRRGTASVKVVNPGDSGSETKPFFINPSATDSDPEEMINHDILMRTTTANSDGIIKRPRRADEEIDYIHNIPHRIVFGRSLAGTPQLPDVLVKLLVFNDPSDLSDYLLTGSISAQYWKNVMDTRNEDDMDSVAVSDQGSYFDAALTPSSRQWSARWKKLMKSAGVEPPSINRSKIKIKRFDYVGHSDEEAFYLLYGWSNPKGVLPGDDVRFETAQLTAALPKKNLTSDAYSHLWGCHQGGKMGPALVGAFKEVTACEASTFFNHVLDSDSAMPVPEEGSDWKTLKRK